MSLKLLLLPAIAVALSGCTTSGGTRQNPIQTLRNQSTFLTQEFARESLIFYETNGQEETITAAKDATKRKLRDPDSALFRDVRLVDFDGGKVVCGEINGKNAYGGYVGYAPFVAGISGANIFTKSSRYSEVDSASNAGIFAACGYR